MDGESMMSGMMGARLGMGGAGARADDLTSRQGDFSAVLARGRRTFAETPAEQKAAAREGAQDFVAITLVQPLLEQLRKSNNAAAPFKPSSAELQFRGMMDAQIAQRIVRATSFPLVDVVARGLERAAAGNREGAT